MWQNVPPLDAEVYLRGSRARDGYANGGAAGSAAHLGQPNTGGHRGSRQASAVRSELELANLAQAARLLGAWLKSSG
jgi:hypothetical protein